MCTLIPLIRKLVAYPYHISMILSTLSIKHNSFIFVFLQKGYIVLFLCFSKKVTYQLDIVHNYKSIILFNYNWCKTLDTHSIIFPINKVSPNPSQDFLIFHYSQTHVYEKHHLSRPLHHLFSASTHKVDLGSDFDTKLIKKLTDLSIFTLVYIIFSTLSLNIYGFVFRFF